MTQPNVGSQMARIRASGAPVFVIFQTPDLDGPRDRDRQGARLQPRADLHELGVCNRVRLNIAIASAGAPYVNGSLSVTSGKDPSNPAQQNDPAMREYSGIMEKYAPGANSNNALQIYGVANAETFVQAMYKAGKNPTRASFMNALLSLNSTNRSCSRA